MTSTYKRSIFDQVAEFQSIILNNPNKSTPVPYMTKEYKHNTLIFLAEELGELEVALNDDDLPETLDALIDLMYFAAGAIHSLGVDGDEAFRRVHTANMAKQGGIKPSRRLQCDATKPRDWTPPELHDLFK